MNITRANSILLLFLIFSISSHSQNEFSKWYFGYSQAGLNFATQPPTALANGSLNAGEGVVTICDAAGNLLFYADAVQIYNSSHNYMANGVGLNGDQSSTQAITAVKQPGSNSIYYVFTNGGPSAMGMSYSIIDMGLAAGMGSVTVKNVNLYQQTCEKQVLVRHCNGKDVWIITHHYGTNEFRTYLLTNTGIVANPVVSAIGETPTGTGNGYISAIGQMKISPDGKKLAIATASSSIPSNQGVGGFCVFDFDAGTGIISNSLTLLSGATLTLGVGAYGVEFSPDGSKLYGTTSPGLTSTFTCTLHQWDICLSNTTAIVASHYSVVANPGGFVGSLQRGIDNKIYMTLGGDQSISVINNPNANGAAMNLIPNAISLSPGMSGIGLPNYINMYERQPYAPFSSSVSCQKVSFVASIAPTFSSGCAAAPYAPSSYLWNFGEPASGSANTSTLTNPVHTYSAMGTYTVSLILYSNCINDTLKQTVTISSPGPTLSVSGASLVCKGTKTTFTASGGSSYQWSNAATTSTAAYTPTATSVYSVTATLNGCSESKSFTLTTNLCTGIATTNPSGVLMVYPNPVKDILNIETQNAAKLTVYDISGTMVMETLLKAGNNELNTENLKPGIYSLRATDEKGMWRARVVKME